MQGESLPLLNNKTCKSLCRKKDKVMNACIALLVCVCCAGEATVEKDLHISDFFIRLRGSSLAFAGRVEIKQTLRGDWGTICDDHWDWADAVVVCRSLGYANAEAAIGGAAFGIGDGRVLFRDVICHGNESSLEYCKFQNVSDDDCSHQRDAGVLCTPTHIGVLLEIIIIGAGCLLLFLPSVAMLIITIRLERRKSVRLKRRNQTSPQKAQCEELAHTNLAVENNQVNDRDIERIGHVNETVEPQVSGASPTRQSSSKKYMGLKRRSFAYFYTKLKRKSKRNSSQSVLIDDGQDHKYYAIKEKRRSTMDSCYEDPDYLRIEPTEEATYVNSEARGLVENLEIISQDSSNEYLVIIPTIKEECGENETSCEDGLEQVIIRYGDLNKTQPENPDAEYVEIIADDNDDDDANDKADTIKDAQQANSNPVKNLDDTVQESGYLVPMALPQNAIEDESYTKDLPPPPSTFYTQEMHSPRGSISNDSNTEYLTSPLMGAKDDYSHPVGLPQVPDKEDIAADLGPSALNAKVTPSAERTKTRPAEPLDKNKDSLEETRLATEEEGQGNGSSSISCSPCSPLPKPRTKMPQQHSHGINAKDRPSILAAKADGIEQRQYPSPPTRKQSAESNPRNNIQDFSGHFHRKPIADTCPAEEESTRKLDSFMESLEKVLKEKGIAKGSNASLPRQDTQSQKPQQAYETPNIRTCALNGKPLEFDDSQCPGSLKPLQEAVGQNTNDGEEGHENDGNKVSRRGSLHCYENIRGQPDV
ncbi:uncharacterized protein LOC5514221 isoform X1 [Nematostella vectensis]|uniref:uncharacterized protein LOC5514221 isoform X1 n=1 Tax=Nematostella vectensis TaxID=45351 RepID=UPI002076FB65|nr:uncharacterized protein LOC5514221 isoform X1 [Nematostella vectensis]